MRPRGDLARSQSRRTDPADQLPPVAARQLPDLRGPHRASMVARAEASFTEPELRTSPPRPSLPREDSGASTPHEPSKQSGGSPTKPRGSTSAVSGLPARRQSPATTGVGSSSPYRDDDSTAHSSSTRSTPTKPTSQRRQLSVAKPAFDDDADGSGGSLVQVLRQPKESSLSAASAPPRLARQGGLPTPDITNSSSSFSGAVSPNRWPKNWQQQIASDMVGPSAATAAPSPSSLANPHPNNPRSESGSGSRSSPSPFVPGSGSPSPALTGPGRRRNSSGDGGSAPSRVLPVGTLTLSSLGGRPGLGSARTSRSGSLSGAPGAGDAPRSPASVSSSMGTDTPTPRSILKQPGTQSRHRNDGRRISFVPPVESPDKLTRNTRRDENSGSDSDRSFSDTDSEEDRRESHHRHRRGSKDGSDDDDEGDFDEPSLSYSDTNHAVNHFYHHPGRDESATAPQPHHHHHHQQRYATVPPDEEDEQTIQESDCRRRRRLMDEEREQPPHLSKDDGGSLSPSHSRSPSNEPPSPDRRNPPRPRQGSFEEDDDVVTEPHSRQRPARPQQRQQTQAPLPAALDPRNRRQPRWPTERRGSQEGGYDDDDDDDDDPPTEAAGGTREPRGHRRGHERESVLPDKDDSSLDEEENNRSSGGSSYETPQKPTRGPSHDSSASNDSGRRHHHHRRDGSDSRHNSASDDGTASPDSEHRRRSRHRRHHRRHGSSSRSPDSSFSSASSHSSPSRSTAPPPPRQQQQQQHPSGIGLPPLPTSPRQQEEPAMDTSTGSRGRRGEKLRDGPTNTYRGGSGGPSPNGSGIFPHEESSTFLNDPSYTPTNASATPSSGQSRNPSGQTTTLADLTVSALSSVDPSSGLPFSPQQQKQQQQQQALLAAGRRSPSLSSVNSSPTKRKPKQAPAATTQPHAQSGGGEEALSPRASTGSNSNSVGKTSLERQPSTITDREDDRSFQSGSGLPDVAAALPGRDGSAPEREGRQRVQKKQQPAPADAASNEEQPQHRKRRTSSAKGTNDSENAHKQLRRQHRRHSVAGPDESQRSEGGGSRASSGSRRRRHRSSSRSPGERTQTADEVGGEGPRRRRRSSSAQAGRADPATVDIQPLPKERQHRPRLDRHLANETNSSIRTVELLSAEDAVGGGLVRAHGTSPSASHTSPPREAAPQHKEQRELKVRRPRSPAEGQGQGPEEDDESILVDRSQRPPEERDNFENGYYNFGVPPDARDETANPHNSRSNSISGGVGADAFEAEAGRKSTPHSRSPRSHSQTSRRSGSNGSSHRHYEHHHKHNHQHDTHSRSSSVSKEESSLSALDAGTGGSKVMRKKLVVVQKKRKKSAAPSADAGTVVQMSLLPIRRASEVLGEDGAKRPLEKLYDHLAASPSSLSRPHSTRERSNGSNSRRSSRGSHAEKEEKAGGTEGMEEEHTQLDRRSFRRALSAASSRSASRRSSMPPSAMPSAREPRDTDEAGTTMATAHRRPSTASRRHSSSNRSHSHSHRHSHRHHPSPSHNAASPMDVTAETAATSRPRRRRHSRRSSGTPQPSAPPHVPSSSAPTYAEGQNDAFYQEMMRNLHQQQRGGHADNDPVDDGTGTSLFDRGPSGITPVNVHVFPHLLSFAGQPQKQLPGGNPMSDDDWPAAVAENRDRAADRHENYGQDNAGVPTFVAMPVIRQKDQFYQAQTGEVPLIDHLLGEGKPKAPLHLTDGTEGEGGEGVEEPLNSFLKVPRSGPTAPPPQLQLQMQQQVARQPSLLYPYRGVAPIQPTPAFAPVIITERADGLSREWQDTLRPSQNKRRRQEEEAMLFGSSEGPAVGAVAQARRTPPLSATRNAEREKAYAAAAEFRGAGTGAPPASGQPTSSSDDEEHGKRHNERQSRRGVAPPRRSKGGDAGAAQQGKSQTLPSSTAVVVDGDKKKRRKEAGGVPPLTALLTHSRSNSSSSSDSIPSTISAGGEEGKKSKGETRPDAPRQEGPSVSPHYAPVGPDAGRKKGKQLAKGRAGKTEKADDSESSDGELAGVLSESSPQQHPVDATAATHTPEKQVPQDKKARGQTKGHGEVPPLPPPLPSPSYGVFEPVTEPAAHSRSASSVSSDASLHKKAKHTKAATKDSKKRKKRKEKGSPRRRSGSQDKKDKLRRRHPERSDEDGEHLETSIAYQLEKIARKRREEEEEEEMERGKAERRARREKEERKREKHKHRSRSRSRSTSHHHRHPSKDKKKADKKADKKDKKKKDKRDKKHKGSRANSTSRYPSVANVFARPSRTDDDSWRGKAESTPRTRSQPPPPPPPPPPLSSADAARPYSSVYRARAGTPPLRPSSYTPRSTAAWDTDPNRSRSGFGFDDTIDPERERRRANIQKALDDIADRRRGEGDGADRYSRYRRPSSSRYNMGSARRDGGGSRTSPYERDGSPHSGGTDRASEAMSGGGGRGRYTPRPSTRWADYIRGASRDDSAERARGQKSYFADSPPRYRDDTYGSVRGTAHGGYTSAAPDSVYGRQRNSTAAPPPPPTPPTPPQQQQQQRTFTSFAADSRNNDIVSTPPKTGEDFGFRKGSPPTAPSAAAASASVRAAPPPPPPPPGATPISRGESPEEIIKEYEVSDPKAMRHFAKTLHTIVDGLRSYQGLS